MQCAFSDSFINYFSFAIQCERNRNHPEFIINFCCVTFISEWTSMFYALVVRMMAYNISTLYVDQTLVSFIRISLN